jgi:hypothetical protein
LDKENKLKRDHGKLGVRGVLSFFFPWEKEENECVRGELVVMCEVSFMKEMCANKRAWKEGVCSK